MNLILVRHAQPLVASGLCYGALDVAADLAATQLAAQALVLGMRHCAQPLAPTELSRLAAVLHLAARLADSDKVTLRGIGQLPTLLLQNLALDSLTLLTNQPDTAAMADVSMFGA